MTISSSVRIDRLREYRAFDFEALAGGLGLSGLTLASLGGVSPSKPNGPDKHSHELGRIKFFALNTRDQDPILISNALADNGPADEPFLYDGRHRFLAAVLRGDATIRVSFGERELFPRFVLGKAFQDYLTGRTDVKPVQLLADSAPSR